MEDEELKYVFRGTTEGFRGNQTSNTIPTTCTTANPSKALVFAISAAYEYKRKGIIYVAESSAIRKFDREEGNCFESYEEEIGFAIAPGEFQDNCPGYISVDTMKEALKKFGIGIHTIVTPQNLSVVLEGMRKMSIAEIEEVVNYIRSQFKKN